MYDLRDDDASFRDEWDEAVEAGTEHIEQELKRRAVDGWEEPVWHQGVEVGAVKKHSDTLLIFMLKGRKPQKYRENSSIEHSGEVSVKIREIVIERP